CQRPLARGRGVAGGRHPRRHGGGRGRADRRLCRSGALRAAAGILMSVIGYMAYLEPWTLPLCAAFLLPQLLFVPPIQHAINRRAAARIKVLRGVSGGIVESGEPAAAAVQKVFSLNMGIYKLKYSMNLGMNMMHYLAVAA